MVIPANAASVVSASAAMPQAVSAPARALQPWPVLRQGHNGTWPPVTVRSLQYLLNAHKARLSVDGVFGRGTKAAVIAFQRSKKLPATGVVRAATWRALLVTVKHGSKGPAVRAVQDQINFRNGKNGHTLNVDGVYGRRTEMAVRAFQRAMAAEISGFRVDGIVGPQTWQALVTEALSG
jgi:peptidoglycan hydrolase-like protein with peptidoglycan-binding domain